MEYPSRIQAEPCIDSQEENRPIRRQTITQQRQQKDKSAIKEMINMRLAIKDLKKRCKSVKGKIKMVNGRKVHKMLYAIKEREEVVNNQSDYESDDSQIIGKTDNKEIKRVYQNLHKNLKEFSIGVDSKSEYILSEKKLNIKKISQKIKTLNSQEFEVRQDDWL